MPMKTGNELIAEFMGAEIKGVGTKVAYWNFMKPNQRTVRVNELRYHLSWDELMPVVDKIEASWRPNNPLDYKEKLLREMRYPVINLKINAPMEHVFNACVTFIIWYNKQPK